MLKELLKRKLNIVAILENKLTGERQRIQCHNIVTNEGDKYYAQRGAAETPANAFTTMYLGATGSPSPGKTSNYSNITLQASSNKVVKTNYPMTDDQDSDNTGTGVDIISWIFEYAAGDGNWTGITEGIISIASASGTDPILTHFSFGGAFNKDSSTTLKVIVNHEASGV